jgi:AAA15 family ATPase/GTPase
LYNQSLGAQIERLTRDADLGISRLALTTERVPLEDDRVVFPRLKTAHVDQGSGEPIEFSLLEEESNGTRRFFAIVGPIVVALDRGDLLVLDELDCSIHPLLTRKLIELFQSNEANPNGAQLIFATHDSTLMNASLLRRDQIWLCEKNSKEATDLFSLCDIERTPRKREALENNYLAGRYGGVPRFGPALEDYEVR